jgi:hypothetical protein
LKSDLKLGLQLTNRVVVNASHLLAYTAT